MLVTTDSFGESAMFSSKVGSIRCTFGRPLVAAISISATIVVGVTLAIISSDYNAVLSHAGQRNLVLTQVLEEHARRAFDLSRASLNDLSRHLVVGGRPVIASDLRERMDHWQQADPLIVSYWVFDASGAVEFTSQAVKTDGVNFADRPYFKAHKAGEDIHVGAMTRGRLDGKWFFSLSKRLVDDKGVFSGVLLASMQTDYFVRMYQQLGLGANDNIGIYRLDGQVVARRLSNWIGDTVPSNASSPMFASLAMSPVGVYRSISPIDGIDRIIGYRTAEGWPIVVGAGTSITDILANWRQRGVWTVGFAMVMLIVLATTLVWGLRTEARQRQRDLAAHREIDAARQAAERANAAKTRFLAAASHDLRQPLHALGMLISSIEARVGRAHAHRFVPVEQCLTEFQRLLSDLMDVARLDSDAIVLDPTTFSINGLMQRFAAMNLPQAESKGIKLKVVQTDILVRTDAVQLGRIVGNLISNAVRYTETGGVVVGCRRRAGKVWLEVCDSGVGIPSDKLDAIFDEFRQLGERSQDRQGSGLGLAIVKRTATLLGLDVRVSSTPGRGSLFAIELPTSG